ncbi:MAG TPA: RNA polymerase sigma factor [Acidimicrobiales bacterium]|nr:RNA polymerase sigma factor [Acidimicrobiales bacterium]
MAATISDVVAAPPRSDGQLVEAVRSGDTQAFSELYQAHVGAVRAVAFRLVHDREAIADVVQDTFFRALRNLGSLQDPARFKPWLMQIARNLATDQLRARGRVTMLDDSAALDLADTGPGPGSVAELRELAKQVQGCVAGLSNRDATAIAMVAQLGFTPEQVAGALGLTAGATKVLLHRARRRMRHALVLQVMVRQPELACPELRQLIDEDPLSAARHVETCETCIDRAADEVMTFELAATEVVPGPATVTPGPSATGAVEP